MERRFERQSKNETSCQIWVEGTFATHRRCALMTRIYDDIIGNADELGREGLDHLLHTAMLEVGASKTSAREKRVPRKEHALVGAVQADGTFGMTRRFDDREDF